MRDKGIKKGLCLLGGLLMLGGFMSGSLKAEAAEDKKVTVAFPQVEGFSETDENGKRSGIVYDFLSEVSKYTDWEYEFVEGEYGELIQAVYDGKIDLMGGMFYREEIEDKVAYPKYSMGYNYSMIFTNKENEEVKPYDMRTMNGKTIGVYANAKGKIERLEAYLDYHNLECEIVYYDDVNDYANCLKNNETDMMLGSDVSEKQDYNIIGTFINEDNYVVASVKSKELIPELNAALEKIYAANPDWIEELYRKYFEDTKRSRFYLNQEEQDYIAGLNPIRVAVIRDRYPLCYFYEGEERGIIVDVLELIEERTGLTFELVKGENYDDVLDLLKAGEADIAGYFMDDNDVAKSRGFIITSPYIKTHQVVIVNKGVSYPSDHLTLVLPEGKAKNDYIEAENLIYAEDCFSCLRKVNRGQADITYMPYIFAEAAVRKENISNVKEMVLYNRNSSISFAFSQTGPKELYYIINKAINNFSDDEINMVIHNNQLLRKEDLNPLTTLINIYPGVFVGIVSVFILLISFIILLIWHSRMKHKLIRYELEKAEAASEVKSEFLSRISVKLRKPINTIIGLTKLIRMSGEVSPEAEDKLEEIETSSQYLHFLLDNIIDMSRIHNKEIRMQAAPFRIDKLVEKIKYMASFQTEEKGICFEVCLKVKHQILIGDMIRIEQSIINLLANAFKFSAPGGKVELEVEELEESKGKAFFRFAVRDNGIGIAEDERQKIFEPFEQSGEADSGKEGSGLGLSISKQLIEWMGGELEVNSTVGKGTEFYFILKLPVGSMEEKMQEFSGAQVLLAEDNDENAEKIISLFRQNGILVERAADGEQAVDLFLARPKGYCDIIFMDIQMPVMDGWEAFRRIRNSGRSDAETVFICAATADDSEEIREKAKRLGMDDFLSKPFEVEQIYRVFKNWQNRKLF